MSNEEALFEMSRAIGRIEADVSAIKADVADLKSRPIKQRAWIAKVVGGIISTVVAAMALLHFGLKP